MTICHSDLIVRNPRPVSVSRCADRDICQLQQVIATKTVACMGGVRALVSPRHLLPPPPMPAVFESPMSLSQMLFHLPIPSRMSSPITSVIACHLLTEVRTGPAGTSASPGFLRYVSSFIRTSVVSNANPHCKEWSKGSISNTRPTLTTLLLSTSHMSSATSSTSLSCQKRLISQKEESSHHSRVCASGCGNVTRHHLIRRT